MIMDEEFKKYSLETMNKALSIKSILKATIFKTTEYDNYEGTYIESLFKRILNTTVNGSSIFVKEKSHLEWFETELSMAMSFYLANPFPDNDMMDSIKKEIDNKFLSFYSFKDCEALKDAGLSNEDIVFLTHNSQSIEFMYNIFFIGNKVIITL